MAKFYFSVDLTIAIITSLSRSVAVESRAWLPSSEGEALHGKRGYFMAIILYTGARQGLATDPLSPQAISKPSSGLYSP